MKFAVNNPGKAITMGLLAQAGAAAAMSAFSVPNARRMGAQKPRPEEKPHHFDKRTIGDEFRINEVITNNQGSPSVAVFPNNDTFVVWDGGVSGSYDVSGRLFLPNGTALSNEFLINEVTLGHQYFPSLKCLANGHAFIVWHGEQTGTWDIYGRIFFPNGTAVTNEFRINQVTVGWQTFPSLAVSPNGNAFITWQTEQTGNYDIFGRIFFPDGTAFTNEFVANQVTTGDQYDSSVTVFPNNNALIAWSSAHAGTWDIYGRIFSPNGIAFTNEFTINQMTIGNQHVPFATVFPNGNALIAWHGNQAGNSDIYGRILSPNGTALTDEFQINQVTTNDQKFPPVATFPNGNALIAWRGDQTGDANIYGRLFFPNGTALMDEFSINQFTTGTPYTPSVATFPNGNALIAWYGDPTGSLEIYGRIFDLGYSSPIVPAVPPISPSVVAPVSPPEVPPVFPPTAPPIPVPQAPLPEALPSSVPPIAPPVSPPAPISAPVPSPTPIPVPMPPVPVPQAPLPESAPSSSPPASSTAAPSVPPMVPPASGLSPVSEPIPVLTPVITQGPPPSGTPTGTYVGVGLATLGAIGLCAGGTWCVVNHKKKKKEKAETQETVMLETSYGTTLQGGEGNYGKLPDSNVRSSYGVMPDNQYSSVPGTRIKADRGYVVMGDSPQSQGQYDVVLPPPSDGSAPQNRTANYAQLPGARSTSEYEKIVVQNEYEKLSIHDAGEEYGLTGEIED